MELRDDFHLWKKFKEGDKLAYTSIYELYSKPLLKYGLYLTSNIEEVEDGMHDLFIKLYIEREKLPLIDNIKAYLIISLKNILLKEYNKKKNNYALDEVNPNLLLTEEVSIEDYLIKMEEDSENKALVDELRAYLTKREQEVVYYRFVCHYSYKKIAETLDLKEQSVKNIIYTSMRKMRTNISYVILFKLWISFF